MFQTAFETTRLGVQGRYDQLGYVVDVLFYVQFHSLIGGKPENGHVNVEVGYARLICVDQQHSVQLIFLDQFERLDGVPKMAVGVLVEVVQSINVSTVGERDLRQFFWVHESCFPLQPQIWPPRVVPRIVPKVEEVVCIPDDLKVGAHDHSVGANKHISKDSHVGARPKGSESI